MLSIGIKYCGGCNPDYDRVAFVEEMTSRLADRAHFVHAGLAHSDIVVAVQGCPAACAELGAFNGSRVFSITNRREGNALVQRLSSAPQSSKQGLSLPEPDAPVLK